MSAALDGDDTTVDTRVAAAAATAAAALAAHEADTTSVHGITDTAALARLASPAFTGTPTAPNPSTADDSTQVATTAWVYDNLTRVTHPNTDDVHVEVYDQGQARWQTVHYDSGWRDISGLLINGWTVGNVLRLRRINWRVSLLIRGLNGSAATDNHFATLPTGFIGNLAMSAVAFDTAGDPSAVRNTTDGSCYWSIGSVGSVSLPVMFEFHTQQSIPASLPGTLVFAAPD